MPNNSTISSAKHFYQQLPDQLVAQYPDLNFEDHCYLRIALDNTLKARWSDLIPRPAYKHLNSLQKEGVLRSLRLYLKNREVLLAHNRQSLQYRKKGHY